MNESALFPRLLRIQDNEMCTVCRGYVPRDVVQKNGETKSFRDEGNEGSSPRRRIMPPFNSIVGIVLTYMCVCICVCLNVCECPWLISYNTSNTFAQFATLNKWTNPGCTRTTRRSKIRHLTTTTWYYTYTYICIYRCMHGVNLPMVTDERDRDDGIGFTLEKVLSRIFGYFTTYNVLYS